LSQEWKLSTSGLSTGDRFMGTGFGTVIKDGYGINYLTGQNILKFGIESKRTSTSTSTQKFSQTLADTLLIMKRTCINGSVVHFSKL